MILPSARAYGLRMTTTQPFFSLAALLALPASLPAAGAELQTEYAQVRKIAMKDAGVRAAYAKADAKLNAKIIEIDPSLRPLVENRNVAPAPIAKHTTPKPPVRSASGQTYVVAKGDTLTSIAVRYRVTAADLKSANGIVDERKLQVGQKLTVPAHSSVARPAVKSDDGIWSRLKSGL